MKYTKQQLQEVNSTMKSMLSESEPSGKSLNIKIKNLNNSLIELYEEIKLHDKRKADKYYKFMNQFKRDISYNIVNIESY